MTSSTPSPVGTDQCDAAAVMNQDNTNRQDTFTHPPNLESNEVNDQTTPASQLTKNVNAKVVSKNCSQSQDNVQVNPNTADGDIPEEHLCGTWQPPIYNEHPEGDAIRRQVEYYFSDKNLPSDAHLLMKTGGAQNLPVSVKHICGFARMRKYKPYRSVVESLKKSAFLDVVDDKYLQRKIPLSLTPTVTPQEVEQVRTEEKKAKKIPINVSSVQKLEPWMTKAMLKPTGFEEYWTDAPISPEVYAQEREIYDSDIPFSSRIETALSRYSSKRKFHQQTAFIFNKFMKYGGINCSQKMFGSLGEKDLEDRTAADIAAVNAAHRVSEDVLMAEDDWEVDFEGVAKGFLSSQGLLAYLVGSTQAGVVKTVNIIRNFYNYLLQHDVCPEYNAQIYAARRVCDVAERELYSTIFVFTQLPDAFNTAASRLHGGGFAQIFNEGQTWDGADNIGGSEKDSRDIMMAAISAHASEEQYAAAVASPSFQVAFEQDLSFEVTKVEMADSETLVLYNTAQKAKPFLKPVGKLHCRRFSYSLERCSTHVEQGCGMLDVGQSFILFIQDDILEACFVGMKIEGIVKGLSIGIHWLERVNTVSPSYFELLPNEFWDKHKAAVREEVGIYGDKAGEYEETLTASSTRLE